MISQNGVAGEEVLDRLVELARIPTPEASFRERQFLDRLDQHLYERRELRARSRRRAAALAALAACFGLALVAFWQLRPSALRYEVAGSALVDGYIESRGDARVRFSDGSELALAGGARARVADVTAHGSRIEVERGQVTLNVVKNRDNAWLVDAGPYTVRVTGTAFDVRWSKDAQRFELDLHHGSVVITGPPIRGAVTLKAGQRLVSLPSGPVTLERAERADVRRGPSPSAGLDAAATGNDVAFDADSVAGASPGSGRDPSAASARDTGASTIAWSRLVAQGKFRQVLDSANARGLDNVLATGSLAELSALADAARYARRSELARRVLLTERKRFPGSGPARDAAFFLGGLQAGGSSAIEWYERYLAESPRGAYASQALGRRLMLSYRERGADASAPLAKDYLERFPQGPYAATARKILDR
jgi:hypothetical protein